LRIASKLPDVGVTIFAVMTELANQHGAINLAQGFPDFDCDPALVDAVTAQMRAGHNQYAPMQGVPALREAIAAKLERAYGAAYDPFGRPAGAAILLREAGRDAARGRRAQREV
jgi:methionine aminotransferase